MIKKLTVVIIVSAVCISAVYLFQSVKTIPSIEVKDAYIDNEERFIFKLQNKGDSEIEVSYRWHLDDPKANKPIYAGKGSVKIPAGDYVEVVENFTPPASGYDCRFLIMNVDVFCNGMRIATYTKQKSPYDWNYSVLPPKQK